MFRPTRIDIDARQQKPAPPNHAGPNASGLGPMLAVGAVILVVVVVLLLVAWRQTDGLTTQLNTLKAQQPTCGSYSGELANIQRLMDNRDYATASSLANLYLTDQHNPPCSAAKQSFAVFAYQAALDDIFATSAVDGQSAVQRWTETERRAEANAVPPAMRLTPMAVANHAYDSHQWALARAAFLKAWSSSGFDRQSLKSVQFYYAILRNGGVELASSAQTRDTGLAQLYLACDLARAVPLDQREACQDLIVRGVPDQDSGSESAASASDPVFAAFKSNADHS